MFLLSLFEAHLGMVLSYFSKFQESSENMFINKKPEKKVIFYIWKTFCPCLMTFIPKESIFNQYLLTI